MDKKKFIEYTTEEFLNEESFVDWVLRSKEDAFWTEFLHTYPEKAEAVEEAKRVLNAISIQDAEITENEVRQLWDRIDQSVSTEKQPQSNIIKIVSSIAAGLLLLMLAVNYFSSPSPQKLQTSFAESMDHVFEDKSSIELNSLSKAVVLEYDKTSKRTIQLDGEAYFEVEKGEDFIVQTELGKVSVLGTKFNVRARNDNFRVTCFEGSVRVESEFAQNSVVLTAGDACFLQDNILVKHNYLSGIVKPDWLKGIYSFNEAQYSEVLDELEVQYNVDIDIQDSLLTRMYSGSFKSGELEQALQNITWPLRLTYSIDGNNVTIK